MSQTSDITCEQRIQEAKKWAMIVYALQAASFVIGVTYIAALMIDYLKAPIAKGTWVESHFTWQIRTFWFSLLWGVLAAISMMWMVGMVILTADILWMVYRIVVGWVRLTDNKPAYPEGIPPIEGNPPELGE